MFGMLKSTLKVVSSVVDIPVSVAADVVTCGGALNGKEEPYTSDAVSRLVKNVKDVVE